MRKIAILLSLLSLAVGIWLLVRGHDLGTACSLQSNGTTGAGVSTDCMNRVTFYFLGFALTIGGLMALMLSLLAMAKRNRYEPSHHVPPAPHKMLRSDGESLRDVA